MADLPEALIDYLQTSPDFGSLHIGEVIPQQVVYPYIWLMRSGEILSDELCHPPSIESVSFDIEVVSDDINEAREVTDQVKEFLRTAELHSIEFVNSDEDDQTVHGFLVEDHDDGYVPRNLDSDEQLHIGTLNLTAILGAIV